MNGDDPEQRTTQPVQASQPTRPASESAPMQPQELPDTPWQYHATGLAAESPANDTAVFASQTLPDTANEVTWTASEFIAHNKGVGWYVALGAATVVIDILLFIVLRDVLTAVVVPVFAVLFGIIAARKPRVMEYTLDNNGLFIGTKLYPYGDFKSFSILDEGAFSSITFLPLKRFMPPVSIYYDSPDEDRILQVLSKHLPIEHREHDMVDRMVRRIRF